MFVLKTNGKEPGILPVFLQKRFLLAVGFLGLKELVELWHQHATQANWQRIFCAFGMELELPEPKSKAKAHPVTPPRGQKRPISKSSALETPTKDVSRVNKTRPVRFGAANTPESKLRGTKTRAKQSPKVPKEGKQVSSHSKEEQTCETAVAEKDLLALDSSDEDRETKAAAG